MLCGVQLWGAGIPALPFFFDLPPLLFLGTFLLIPPFLHRLCLIDLPLLRMLLRRFESWFLLVNSLLGIASSCLLYTHPGPRLYGVTVWITATPLALADALALSPYLTLASHVRPSIHTPPA